MKPSLPAILSLNGGYVDTAGFLALQGLFTAHVTGNFVTFGAAMVHGTSGAWAKLLALPVFCIVVMLVRLLGYALAARGLPQMRTLLGLKFALLTAAGIMAVCFGPFADSDAWRALLTGMTLVTAMAIQNAIHRIHLGSAPPTTLMTGTTTQVMIDLVDLARGLPADQAASVRGRLGRMSGAVAAFALGCGLAALLYVLVGMWCFLVPPLLALCAAYAGEEAGVPASAK
ncbi:YoaK family protein [Roseixanthobacter pseudopolyaromaticivorans]|uniref:YoaK family protein n=1 Tax=Xanthobacteraceae TaxID=335928 RepID=UPI00372B10C1